jgi:hypothetical protein
VEFNLNLDSNSETSNQINESVKKEFDFTKLPNLTAEEIPKDIDLLENVKTFYAKLENKSESLKFRSFFK